jgi:hypothetical protein
MGLGRGGGGYKITWQVNVIEQNTERRMSWTLNAGVTVSEVSVKDFTNNCIQDTSLVGSTKVSGSQDGIRTAVRMDKVGTAKCWIMIRFKNTKYI